MITKASSIKGLPLFVMSQSQNMGKAKDVIYNPDAKKIEAILVKKSKAILISDVKSIGKDAIIVESDQMIKDSSQLPENVNQLIKSKKTLPKSKVMTENGVSLGKISDVLFDSSSGIVQEFELSQGPIKDLESGKKTIKVSDVINMNEKMMVVKSSAEQETEKQSKEKGVMGMMSKIKENPKVKEITQKSQEKSEQQTPPQSTQNPKTESAVQDLTEEGIEIRGEQSPPQSKIQGVFKPNEKPSGSSGNLEESKNN